MPAALNPRPLVQACQAARRTFRWLRMAWLAVDRAVVLVLVLKALILFDLGEDAYRARLANYRNPDAAQRIGLAVMTLDPVTLKLRDIATQISRLRARGRRIARR